MTGFSSNYTNDPDLGALNDLYLDEFGNIATVSGEQQIEENCYHVIQLTLGDYDYNTTLGIPYDVYLSSNAPIGNQLKLSITSAVLAVSGVKSIDSFTLDIDTQTRILQLNLVINLVSSANQIIITI